MFNQHALSVSLHTVSLTVALFGVAYCLTQQHDRRTFRILACYLSAEALTNLGVALAPVVTSQQIKIILHGFWLIGVFAVAPLLWLHVRSLTSSTKLARKSMAGHLFLPALGLLAFLWLLVLPPSERLTVLPDPDKILGPQGYFTGRPVELLFLVLPLQWACYLTGITRRLFRYRSRLKDVFASTEKRELRWISVVVALYAAYWVTNIASLIFEIITRRPGLPPLVETLHDLILISVIALWGSRQRRYVEPSKDEHAPRYAKSALTGEMSANIAKQLGKAMREDRLYLDPNLSLWSLARHIRVSGKYVTQVLNEEIGENFFDFVNRHRIEAAKARLEQGNDTILSITYDVGFNSRSSFYTAFRKVTGLTPTAYRKTTR